MITSTVPAWQAEFATAVQDPAELLRRLKLPADTCDLAKDAGGFPLRVPICYIARMRKGDPHDPLLRQVLPTTAESAGKPGYSRDPVGDGDATMAPGILHKYQGRVLLITTGACPIHCRYCFRRHYPYGGSNSAGNKWETAVDYIAADESVHEVILSGGDPLSIADDRLSVLAEALQHIPHVKRLRLHTRMPVVIPSRVDPHLLEWLGECTLGKVVVVHVNHPCELDDSTGEAIRRLAGTGATLLNQSVLLKGINDNPDTLAELSEALFLNGILPYYLHQLDRVEGASHFAVPEMKSLELMDNLRIRLPGYLIPRLVREKAGMPYKLPRVTAIPAH